MIRAKVVALLLTMAAIAWAMCGRFAHADPFTSSYTDGTAWNVIYGTGFRPWNNNGEDPGLVEDDVVPLSRFEFFFSEYDISLDTNDHDGDGLDDDLVEATNIRLAIVNNTAWINLLNLTTASAELEGLSTNTIASTAGMATGDPIQFNFSGTDLIYGSANWYLALLVNVNQETGALTPVLAPTIVANYTDDPTIEDDPMDPGADDTYPPATNYGDESDPAAPIDYFLSVFNYHHTDQWGRWLDAWTHYADANFIAYYDTTFPPEGLPGDFNGDNKVDNADYTVWRDNLGAGDESSLGGNGDGSGSVDEGDFDLWRMHWGEMGMGGGSLGGGGSAVPEPSSILLAGLAGLATWLGRRRGAVGPRR